MTFPKEGSDGLPKDGCYWITLKIIFQGPNGPKTVKFCFATFCHFSQKRFDNLFIFLLYTASWGLISELSRDGFHRIIQKVIFKVGKVRFSPFSHNYWYYSVVRKCCENVLHHVASLLWNQSCPKIWKVWNQFKSHFQGQKGSLWSISANISETVHRMMKVCMKHIQ